MTNIADILSREQIVAEDLKRLFYALRCPPREVSIGSAFPERGMPLRGWVVADLGLHRDRSYYAVYCETASETGEQWGVLRGRDLLHCTSVWFRRLEELLDAWAHDRGGILPVSHADVRAEFDWFACDKDGLVAVFTTGRGEAGVIPACVFSDSGNYELLAGYLSLARRSMRAADSFWGRNEHFQKTAERRGLFAFDRLSGGRTGYTRRGVPKDALCLHEMNEPIRKCIEHLCLRDVSFREAATITNDQVAAIDRRKDSPRP